MRTLYYFCYMSVATQRFAGKAEEAPYRATYPIRIVTAASLFDGHDAEIGRASCRERV